MSEVMSFRPDKDDLDFIKKLSKEMKVPQSTYLKQLIHEAVLMKKKENALEGYLSGKFTLREAAGVAGISIREMMEEIMKGEKRIFGKVKTPLKRQLKFLGR